jgi:deoxyribodipyrimidine photo-lyase
LVTALLWLRRDLRVHDHPALRATLEVHDQVVPVFCFDDRLLHGRHAGRTVWTIWTLADR